MGEDGRLFFSDGENLFLALVVSTLMLDCHFTQSATRIYCLNRMLLVWLFLVFLNQLCLWRGGQSPLAVSGTRTL